MANIAIIDYGAGNLHSVCAGFQRVMSASDTLELVQDASRLDEASHIVLPGVGAFADCINALRACKGMIEKLEILVRQEQRPFLGICVGMQMLLEEGLEHGRHQGLGWIKGSVIPITPTVEARHIPHMGWNELYFNASHPVTEGLQSGEHAYFVHSYHAECTDKADKVVIATTDYGTKLNAIIASGNIVGTQFHPEKSQHVGARILANFIKMG